MIALRTVLVFVSDPAKCAAFYSSHLGFYPGSGTPPSPTYCEIEAGGVRIAFHQAQGPDGARTEPTGGPSNPYKLVFATDEFSALHARLRAAGVEVREVQLEDQPRFDAFDCEGHRFQIVQA